MPEFTGMRCGMKVAVLGHAVGAGAFVALAEQQREVRLAPGTAHAAHRVGDDGGGIDEVFAKQRQQRQQDARGITSRRGDQAGGLDLRRADLRQAVNRSG
jgi:hypothetical protein